MAIATLSAISAGQFRGMAGITARGTGGLRATLNTIITKVNEIISTPSFSSLTIGSGTGPYYGASKAYFQVAGSNYPTVYGLRIQDQNDGSWKEATISGGAWVIA